MHSTPSSPTSGVELNTAYPNEHFFGEGHGTPKHHESHEHHHEGHKHHHEDPEHLVHAEGHHEGSKTTQIIAEIALSLMPLFFLLVIVITAFEYFSVEVFESVSQVKCPNNTCKFEMNTFRIDTTGLVSNAQVASYEKNTLNYENTSIPHVDIETDQDENGNNVSFLFKPEFTLITQSNPFAFESFNVEISFDLATSNSLFSGGLFYLTLYDSLGLVSNKNFLYARLTKK